jgi:hypothetical protein
MSNEQRDPWERDDRTWNLVRLLIECRDALPAISLASAKLHGLDLTLADRIDRAIEPWKTSEDDPEAI